jgi:hypothetical protein
MTDVSRLIRRRGNQQNPRSVLEVEPDLHLEDGTGVDGRGIDELVLLLVDRAFGDESNLDDAKAVTRSHLDFDGASGSDLRLPLWRDDRDLRVRLIAWGELRMGPTVVGKAEHGKSENGCCRAGDDRGATLLWRSRTGSQD